jgi:hypothetical protein
MTPADTNKLIRNLPCINLFLTDNQNSLVNIGSRFSRGYVDTVLKAVHNLSFIIKRFRGLMRTFQHYFNKKFNGVDN